MAHPNELDDALQTLAQAFADIGLMLDVLQRLKNKANPLRGPLVDELHTIQELISRVLVLL